MQLSESVRAFLNSQPIGHLATADAQGAPHVVPVCFALINDEVFIAIDEKPKSTMRLKRLRNIEQNPQAALTVDFYDKDWSRLRWVMLRGLAEIEYGKGVAEAIIALRKKYPQYRSTDFAGRPVIRLRPERLNEWASTVAEGSPADRS